MPLKLLAFATAADRLGWREREVEPLPGESARQVLARMAPEFDLGPVRVAIDCDYRAWDEPIPEGAQELAILPPVSGG